MKEKTVMLREIPREIPPPPNLNVVDRLERRKWTWDISGVQPVACKSQIHSLENTKDDKLSE